MLTVYPPTCSTFALCCDCHDIRPKYKLIECPLVGFSVLMPGFNLPTTAALANGNGGGDDHDGDDNHINSKNTFIKEKQKKKMFQAPDIQSYFLSAWFSSINSKKRDIHAIWMVSCGYVRQLYIRHLNESNTFMFLAIFLFLFCLIYRAYANYSIYTKRLHTYK